MDTQALFWTVLWQHCPVCGLNLRERAGGWVLVWPGILAWKVHTQESALVHTQEAKNKRLNQGPPTETIHRPPPGQFYHRIAMAGSSGMRFLFEGRGGEGRTWHSRLEFSSLTDQVCSYLIAGPWFQILQNMTIYILHINIIPILVFTQHMALIHVCHTSSLPNRSSRIPILLYGAVGDNEV